MGRKYNLEEKRLIKKERNKKYNQIHKEEKKLYNKEYNKKNKKEKKLYNEKYYKTNKENINLKIKENYQNHKKEKKKYNKEYRKTHKEKINKCRNNRRQIDINFKLACYLRTRFWCAIQNKHKTGSTVKDLGCSIPELKTYLESKFQEGMSWDNYCYRGWHIDHIIPLSSFNLQIREEFLKANHYTNLQPLWAEENLKKGSKNNV
jgi:uncharacterized protein with gpF-like domain